MCGWMSMTGMCVHSRADWRKTSRIDLDEHLVELRARRYQLLLQAVGDERLDAGAVRRHAVGQRIAHQRQEIAIALVLRAVAAAALELVEIRLLRRHEGVHQGA